jgi:hypothetical protein
VKAFVTTMLRTQHRNRAPAEHALTTSFQATVTIRTPCTPSGLEYGRVHRTAHTGAGLDVSATAETPSFHSRASIALRRTRNVEADARGLERTFMQRSHLLFASVLLAAATSHAAAGEACNAQSFENTCTGEVLTACQPDQQGGTTGTTVEVDCDHRFGTEGGAQATETLTCADVECDGALCPSVLKDCVGAGENAVCIGFVPGLFGQSDANFMIGCGAGFACKLGAFATGTAGEFALAEQCAPRGETGDCTPDDIHLGCQGDVATHCIAGKNPQGEGFALKQPFTLDCAVFQGTCAVADIGRGQSAPVCQGLPVDSPCDDQFLLCADGLVCDVTPPDPANPNAGSISACQEPKTPVVEDPDENTTPPGTSTPSRDDEEEEADDDTEAPAASGCSATDVAGNGAPVSLAVLGLLGLCLTIRRRR